MERQEKTLFRPWFDGVDRRGFALISLGQQEDGNRCEIESQLASVSCRGSTLQDTSGIQSLTTKRGGQSRR